MFVAFANSTVLDEAHHKAWRRKVYWLEEIFDDAVSNGSGAATTSTETVTRDTTFSTKVNVPAGKKLYIWLNYDNSLALFAKLARGK